MVVPCFNEAGNIKALCEKISQSLKYLKFEIILVNDGSTDNTLEEIQGLINAGNENIRLINHDYNKGLAFAWLTGLNAANSKIICFIDADLQNPPEAISLLFKTFQDSGCEVVQAVRSSIGRVNDNRFFFSRGLNFLLNLFFNQKTKDSKSGFLLGRKYVFENIFNHINDVRYFQTFIGVLLRKYKYNLIEIETLFKSRNVGKSFLNGSKAYRVVLLSLFDIVIAKYRFRKIGDIRFEHDTNSLKSLSILRRIRFELFFATTPMHKWLIGKDARNYYLWLKSIEFQSNQDLRELQFKRMMELLRSAYANVPYYKHVFDENKLNLDTFTSIEDLGRVPLLTKDLVRENIHFRMFSNLHDKKKMLQINTSGSTGEPFICYADKFQLEMRFATTLRAAEMSGYKFGDKQIRLWHQTLGMSKSQILRERIDSFFVRRTFVPAFEMTSESINALMHKISRKKYKFMDGYAESLNFIASQSTDMENFSLKGIMSSAQQLTPQTREKIENMFGCQVFDKYGSREFSGIAYQCDQSKFHHVQDESYIVEILVDGRPANPGEVGEIVITDLNNFSVPLIRYRIGDLAQAVEQIQCKCGRSQKLIGEITGRTQAMIGCANGVWLPGGFFGHFFKDYDFCIKHYQVYQEIFGAFTIKLVITEQYNDSIAKKIVNSLKAYAGDGTVIEVEIVDSIPLVRTGKRSPVVSMLKQDFQTIQNLVSKPIS